MSGRKIVLTDEAVEDLIGTRLWYSQPGAGEPAKRVLRHLDQSLRSLGDFPFIGRKAHVPGTRVLAVSGHRVVYRVTDDQIVVVAVFGPGQSRP